MTYEVVSQLDLSDVGRIYAERHGCSPEEAGTALDDYRMFLDVVRANPDLKCVPNERQDRVWHICMEDSEKYERDCMRFFGRALKHDADYFGTPAFYASWQATRDATRRQFGLDPDQQCKGDISSRTVGQSAAKCGGMLEDTAAKCGGMQEDIAAKCGGMLEDTAARCAGMLSQDVQKTSCGGSRARVNTGAIELLPESSVGYGRGIRVTRKIKAGELLDQAPVIEVPPGLYDCMRNFPLETNSRFINITYGWQTKDGQPQGAIAFGLCSLCQHSRSSNAKIVLHVEERMVELWATKDIEEGEEVFITYTNAFFEEVS